jgi:acetyl esterase/lipase
LRRATSLDALVTTNAPPFFIWHTAEDPYVPVERAYRLASSLAAHGVPHAVHVFAHGPHSLGLAIGAGEPAAWTELGKRGSQSKPRSTNRSWDGRHGYFNGLRWRFNPTKDG